MKAEEEIVAYFLFKKCLTNVIREIIIQKRLNQFQSYRQLGISLLERWFNEKNSNQLFLLLS